MKTKTKDATKLMIDNPLAPVKSAGALYLLTHNMKTLVLG